MSEEKNKEENLVSHLEELRETLIKCFIAIGILLPITFYFSPKALDFLIKILVSDTNITLNYFAPMEVFILQIKLALLMSIIIAFPYITKQLWNFILPALYEHEKNFIRNSAIISSILFALGVTFCIFLILPIIIKFGMSFAGNNINAMLGVSNIVSLSLWLGFTFGFMFQVPLVTHMLIKWDILSYETISTKRPYVVVVLLIISALLTPPDIISQLLLFSPTYLLFELGLIFSKDKRKQIKTQTNNNVDID